MVVDPSTPVQRRCAVCFAVILLFLSLVTVDDYCVAGWCVVFDDWCVCCRVVAAAAAPAAPAPVGARTEKRVQMSMMRTRISQRLKESQNTTAMLTTFQEVCPPLVSPTCDVLRSLPSRAAPVNAFRRLPAVGWLLLLCTSCCTLSILHGCSSACGRDVSRCWRIAGGVFLCGVVWWARWT